MKYEDRMRKHWTETLKQVEANGLYENWIMFAETMENVISDNVDGKSNAYVIPMATGESKTQGASLYCSMLPDGVQALIVVYRIDDADIVADTINRLGGNAVAYHSKCSSDVDEVARYETVVITHEMFKKHGYRMSDKWKILSTGRDLVIIDETLNDIKMSSVGDFEINILKNLSRKLNVEAFRDQSLAVFEKTLNELKGKAFRCLSPLDYEERNRVMLDEDMDVIEAMHDQCQDFIDILESTPLDNPISVRARGLNTVSIEPVARAKDIEAVKVMRDALVNGCFGDSESRTINIASQLLPKQISYVVLDATANINAVYETQSKHKRNVITVPVKRVRDYSNVKIHTVLTATGKGSLSAQNIEQMLNSVPVNVGDRILYVCHKINEPGVIAHLTNSNFVNYAVDHWGNLTGTNKYRGYNKIILIGLPHKPASIFHAINIYKADEEYAYSSNGSVSRQKLQHTDMAADIVQAIARIRLRNIVGINGECDECEVFLTVNPNRNIRETIYDSLAKQFPGAQISDDWDIPGNLISRKRETVLEATLAYIDSRLRGIGEDIPVLEPRQNLNLDKSNYAKMMKLSSFPEHLLQIGVEIQERYVTDRRGRQSKKPRKFYTKIKEPE